MTEREQVAALLEKMGADAKQAEVMAGQLLKRSEQIAVERGIDRLEALTKLLELVRSGRAGESPEDLGN
ncbi:hypothetical protein [Pelagicoccus albus]|uniref:Uncharacterized protein n=1 Tax=Pelagicoccus albus TaxID=415222 RepID=A0A7X1B6H9_9BACT|nr:hypothetical protein [Pelagicoccus albus]MBC2606569.1 hypothetical protein [Pelagicoccus albus]